MKATSVYQIIHQLMRLHTLPCVSSSAMDDRQGRVDALHVALDGRGYKGPRPSRQLTRMTADVINAALYATDPMETCCKENDRITEYQVIALTVLQNIQNGMVMEAALDQALCEIFGDHLVNGEQIERVMHELVGMSQG
ncbi:hypothetical protein EGC76_04385 [Pseudidiomarina gelatinasegens]|jgi:hypothetical protein|uniref:Uncharacterized protein n=1 Tax=Pseudidiomarina gelatinasegens TaxID=2487740 RepID=A0A451GEK0_9GAMM|nr:hypothetical protein [Pseudidiomarina gelatinasegens]RWU11508.1 hypothetical protein EGC76_04385 [Pseudidiomarina gelatinasegens]